MGKEVQKRLPQDYNMIATPVIAIFDVGKTNKKLFLFNKRYEVVEEESYPFPEIADEDGFPTEDIHSVSKWVKTTIDRLVRDPAKKLVACNWCAYGASFVHLDKGGKILTPLYNYLKPYPEELQEKLYEQYEGAMVFARKTASPLLGNLNSGLQLYRLKEEKPELFRKIHYALHLPQYLSYLLTGRIYSDITSIGCHTALWDFGRQNYHEWVAREQLLPKMAPIHAGDQGFSVNLKGHPLVAGVGLHDSSSALIPYLAGFIQPFALLSTGTWCITLNPFNQSSLTADELEQDCLCYMEYRGKPVKASRLFAGQEHDIQSKRIAEQFNQPADFYKRIEYQPEVLTLLGMKEKNQKNAVSTPDIESSGFEKRNLSSFNNVVEAYHQLISDLVSQQVYSTNLVLLKGPVRKIFVDGGFGRNALYMQLLANAFPRHEVYAASLSQASALGAALAIHHSWNENPLPRDFIELKYFPAAKKQGL